MSLLSQFSYADIIDTKIDSIYAIESERGQTALILNIDLNVLVLSVKPGQRYLDIVLLPEDEFMREYEGANIEKYYPYLCFEGNIIKNVVLRDYIPGEECLELVFSGDDKRIRIGYDYSDSPILDLDMIRPGFTINFGNKSIEEVEALLFDKSVEASSYVEMTKEVRAVYYYYSCLTNVFTIAGYIYEIFRRSPYTAQIDRPKAYQLARKLVA